MNLTRKILEGIQEVEFEINPEMQKQQPQKGKPSTSYVMGAIQDYAKMQVLNLFAGPKVEFPGNPSLYSVAADSNMFADIHEKVQKSQLWWKWDENDKQFTMKPGFDHTAPEFWSDILNLADYFHDAYVVRPEGGHDRSGDDRDDGEEDDGVEIASTPEVNVYNSEVGGTEWKFGKGYTVSGRLSANELVLDAEASTALLYWNPYEKVRYIFEWLAMNTPPGALIKVANVEAKEVPVMEKLKKHGLIHSFSMRNKK